MGRLSPVLDLVAAAAVLLLVVSTAILGSRDRADDPAQLGAVATAEARAILDQRLYFSTDPMQQLLTPIDPHSLQDRPDSPPVTIAPLDTVTAWALSGDGSTLATIEVGGPDAATTIISNAVTGIERSRIPVSHFGFRLNHDGSRILIPWFRADSMAGWLVYDTASAQQLSSIPPEDTELSLPGWSRADLDVPDPMFRTLYRIVPVGQGATPILTTPGPYDRPTELRAYDLSTGSLVGSVALPGLVDELMGSSPDPDSTLVEGQNRFQMAVSPDGSQLAIPSLDGTTVAMIDAESLTITQMLSLVLPSTDSSPSSTNSTTEGRSIRSAVFAPAGDRLYLYGFDGTRSQGLQVLDLRTGTVVAFSFADEDVLQVVPSPDAQELFIVSRVSDPNLGKTHLRRVDPSTLDVRAMRTYSAFELPILVLQPAVGPPLG